MVNVNLTGDVFTKKAPSKDSSYGSVNSGPWIGIVKQNSDPEKMGRLAVTIPNLTKSPEAKANELIICEYLTPFYGAKSNAVTNADDPTNYDTSQHSYGFWAVPPDIDSRVLVIFAEGKISNAFWIGCVQDANTNHMVPGIASSTQTGTDTKETVYGTDNVPAGEINRKAWNQSGGNYENIKKPIHPMAETLRAQGLIQDTVRGTTSSSARRESPSQVFGMSTPGPVDKTKPTKQQGPIDSLKDEYVTRKSGHTFVMDDGDENGDNHLVRLRSSSGHQILLHDTEGCVYIANASGEAWLEFASNGTIDIYAGAGLNVRSAMNMNFHSDANISFYAGEQIKFKATDKLVLDGSRVQVLSDNDIMLHAEAGTISLKSPTNSIISYAGKGQQHHAGGRIDHAGTEVHMNSVAANADIISHLIRTDMQATDIAGTNTLVVPIADVNTATKGLAVPLRSEPGLNQTMDGMRVPTHEPFAEHFGLKNGLSMFSGAGSQPWR